MEGFILSPLHDQSRAQQAANNKSNHSHGKGEAKVFGWDLKDVFEKKGDCRKVDEQAAKRQGSSNLIAQELGVSKAVPKRDRNISQSEFALAATVRTAALRL